MTAEKEVITGRERLPEGSALLESSQTGGIIGDPRWDPDYGVGVDSPGAVNSVRVYPNPAHKIFSLELPETLVGTPASIYNALGMEVKKYTEVYSDRPMDISELESGIYFIRIGSNNQSIVKLMVK